MSVLLESGIVRQLYFLKVKWVTTSNCVGLSRGLRLFLVLEKSHVRIVRSFVSMWFISELICILNSVVEVFIEAF